MLEITAYEIHHYEVLLVDKDEKHIFYTEDEMIAFVNEHENERFLAQRIDYPIFTEKEKTL